MVCPSCGRKSRGNSQCGTCAVKQRLKNIRVCPQWVALASNKMLPPMVFFSISLVAFSAAAVFDSTAARFALALAGALSSAVGLYILGS